MDTNDNLQQTARLRWCPCLEKMTLKVLGKEFEEEPFFKRVFLNKTHIVVWIEVLVFFTEFAAGEFIGVH